MKLFALGIDFDPYGQPESTGKPYV